MGRFSMPSDKRSKDDQQLTKITRDSSSMAVEQIKGMSSQVRNEQCTLCRGICMRGLNYHIRCLCCTGNEGPTLQLWPAAGGPVSSDTCHHSRGGGSNADVRRMSSSVT